jgi:hypothetical protein
MSAPYPDYHERTFSQDDIPLASWTLHLEHVNGTADVLVLDPVQNLLIVRVTPTSDSAESFRVVKTLDTGGLHPECTAPGGVLQVPDPGEWIDREAHYTRYSVVGGTFLITFANTSRCENIFLDWRTGHVLARFQPETPIPMKARLGLASTMTLLTSKSFLHGTYDNQIGYPYIDVYVLQPADDVERAAGQATYRIVLLMKYQLPQLVGVPVARINVNIFPLDRTLSRGKPTGRLVFGL